MPKILASSLPSAAPRAGAADLSSQLLSTSNKASRKDRAGGAFDDLLTGARKREAASQPKPDESQRTNSSRPKSAKESSADEASDERSSEEVGDARESKATESKRSTGKPQKKSKDSQEQAVDPADDGSTVEAKDADSADESKTVATDDAAATDAGDDESTEIAAHDKAKDAGDEPEDGELDPAQLAVLLQHRTATESNSASDPSAGGESQDGDPSGADPVGEFAAQLAPAGNRVARASAHVTAKSPATVVPNAAGADAAAAPKLGQAPAVKAQGAGAATAASDAASSVEALDDDSEAKAAADAGTATSAAHAATPDAAAGAAHALEAAIDQQAAAQHAQAKPDATSTTQPQQQQDLAPEVRFADDNHDNIVSGVRGQLMPNGGTMRIRLDPPELGPLAVTVRLRNGVMEASFEASSDEAAKLLSHSLGSLKTSLESQGVNVERLHVQQAPKSEQTSSQGDDRDGGGQQQGQQRDLQQEQQARQEHQRREMIRRMWRKLRGVDDPLDMVA
jgi:flagellar hook-length control protein FliK